MNIREKLQNIFEENGVDTSDSQQLREIDSVQYITIIVEIEQKFNIVLPDSYIEKNVAEDFDVFVDMIQEILKSSNYE